VRKHFEIVFAEVVSYLGYVIPSRPQKLPEMEAFFLYAFLPLQFSLFLKKSLVYE